MVFKELLPSYFTKDTIFIGSKTIEVCRSSSSREKLNLHLFYLCSCQILFSECLRATHRKVAPRLPEKPLLKITCFNLVFHHMLIFAPRPSEASIKTYERSEFIVAFAWNSQTILTQNCPQTEQSEVKMTRALASAIGQFFTPLLLFILLISF